MSDIEISRSGRVVQRVPVEPADDNGAWTVHLEGVGEVEVSASKPAVLDAYEVRLAAAVELPGYDVQAKLGAGGMGTVWRAVQQSTNHLRSNTVLTRCEHALRHSAAYISLQNQLNHLRLEAILTRLLPRIGNA